MNRYRNNPAAIRALVEDDRIHRDLYLDPELYELERERVFAAGWIFLGHDSQIPARGDFVTTMLAGVPVIMVRHSDDSVRVLVNRCAHKGAVVESRPAGTVGRFLRCPYHAWSYRTDGAPIAVPLKEGYAGTNMAASSSGQGLTPVATAVYRGFVFARLAPQGLSFEAQYGAILQVLDNLADRSPQGRLRVAGGILRMEIACNWKLYLENINDAVHPVSTHESVARAARDAAGALPEGSPLPMALEQLLPFSAGYQFFVGAGARVYPGGHSVFGTRAGIHSSYSDLPDYQRALEAAHGPERAHAILAFAPQNSVLFPSLVAKSSLQTLRVIRPLAVDRTVLEVWALALEGAPEVLLERTLTYNRLAFSPMSIVAHDDIHVFESIQRATAADANPWISLHREQVPGEVAEPAQELTGTNEWTMRNHYRAWVDMMTREGNAR
jgi:phenylpropionate dioxygenase-like ring-hydroxylating dioxygenase large terminal subunit